MSSLNQYFDNFITCENFLVFIHADNWFAKINNVKDIKDIFDLANNVEKMCINLEEKKLSEDFFVKLNDYLRSRGRISFPDLKTFQKACDVLLMKFLTDSRIADNMVEIAVQQYCSYCQVERVSTVIRQFVDVASAFSVLESVASEICDPINIEARLIYEILCKRVNYLPNNVTFLNDFILEMLNDSVRSISVVFQILCFKDDNEISKIIKDCIVSKLTSSSELKCVQIWQCFIELPLDKITFIVVNFPSMLDAIFNLVTNMSESFNCDYTDNKLQFVSNLKETLQFSEIVKLLNLLYNISGTPKERVENYLNSKKNSVHFIFFEEIENQCIKNK